MDGIMKIIDCEKNVIYWKKKVLKLVSETVKSEAKEQKGGFLASYWVH